MFFRDVPSSTQFDLLETTLQLVQRHKTALDFGLKIDAEGWWLGPLEDGNETDEVA
jgi:hypothetical protein